MKKTLITLAALALATVAQAADVEIAPATWNSLVANVVTPGTTTNTASTTSFTLIAVMDWDDAIATLSSYNSTHEQDAYIYGKNGANKEVAQGFSLIKQGDDIYAYICQWKDTTYTINAESTNPASTVTNNSLTASGDGATLKFDRNTYENKGKLALTLSYNDSTNTFTLGALKADGTLGTLTKVMTDGWNDSYAAYTGFELEGRASNGQLIEHAMWFNTALSNDQIAAVAAAIVPEPTTATLSLLALAGLAARRRRK